MKTLGKTILWMALGWAGAALAAFGPGEKVIVLNSGEGSISIIDPVTMKEERRVPIGKEPHHLMATPDNKELIVASAASNDLVFLDPKTGEILRRVSGISDPYQIAYSPDRKWFVVRLQPPRPGGHLPRRHLRARQAPGPAARCRATSPSARTARSPS